MGKDTVTVVTEKGPDVVNQTNQQHHRVNFGISIDGDDHKILSRKDRQSLGGIFRRYGNRPIGKD